MKTQILKRERTWSGDRQGFDLGRAVRSLLCGVVLVGSLVGTSSWAQLPESAMLDPAALEEALLGNMELEKKLLKEGLLEEERLKKELLEKKVGGELGGVGEGLVDEKLVEEMPDLAVIDKATLGETSASKSDFSVEALKQLSADAQSLLARSADTVVSIDGGSGVIVSEDGWVMTASHVCGRPGRQIQVRLANGLTWPARTFGADRQKDTGMVKLLGDHVWPFVEAKEQVSVEPGDWCVVMGYPWDTETLKTPAVRLGRVTSVDENRIVTDVPIIGGDSGGPVFNTKGDLLAINSRIRLDVNQNIHIPIATFVRQIGALRRVAFVRSARVRKNEDIADSLAEEFGRSSAEVRNTVADLAAKTEASVVRLVSVKESLNQGSPAREVLGTIVTESGLVVAKQSELFLPVKARVDGDWMEAEMVAYNLATDLSLLQLKPKADRKFAPVQIDVDVTEEKLIGRLILSLTKSSKDGPLAASVGTIMVEPRSFRATAERQGVDLGVVLDVETKQSGKVGVGISRVYPKSLAVRMGLRNGDRLVSINGRDVVDEASLNQVLSGLAGGQQTRFSIRRQGELLSFRMVLPASLPVVWDRWGGGPFSDRRFGFGTVIAHDGVIDPGDCGGPVIDLNGKFVGVNVSRAMRTTTFVVPATVIQALIQQYQRSQ